MDAVGQPLYVRLVLHRVNRRPRLGPAAIKRAFTGARNLSLRGDDRATANASLRANLAALGRRSVGCSLDARPTDRCGGYSSAAALYSARSSRPF